MSYFCFSFAYLYMHTYYHFSIRMIAFGLNKVLFRLHNETTMSSFGNIKKPVWINCTLLIFDYLVFFKLQRF